MRPLRAVGCRHFQVVYAALQIKLGDCPKSEKISKLVCLDIQKYIRKHTQQLVEKCIMIPDVGFMQ